MGSINKTSIILFGILLTLSMSWGGCAFEEGPISFRSVSKRLENIWVYEKAYENGEDITFQYSGDIIDIDSDGEIIIISSFTGVIFQGTWDFNDHTDRILLDLTETSSASAVNKKTEWHIMRLSKDEFIAEEYTGKIDNSDDNKYRYEFRPKD